VFVQEVNKGTNILFGLVEVVVCFVFPDWVIPIEVAEPKDMVSVCGADLPEIPKKETV
jgi:hypothetical protein